MLCFILCLMTEISCPKDVSGTYKDDRYSETNVIIGLFSSISFPLNFFW